MRFHLTAKPKQKLAAAKRDCLFPQHARLPPPLLPHSLLLLLALPPAAKLEENNSNPGDFFIFFPCRFSELNWFSWAFLARNREWEMEGGNGKTPHLPTPPHKATGPWLSCSIESAVL